MSADGIRAKPLLKDGILTGTLEGFDDGTGVLIGRRMSERVGLRVGDKVTFIAPRGTTTAFGTMPRMKAYSVAAIFEVGMSEYDLSFVFMPIAAAQTFFRQKGGVSISKSPPITPIKSIRCAARSLLPSGPLYGSVIGVR